jgi:hypothetical protein
VLREKRLTKGTASSRAEKKASMTRALATEVRLLKVNSQASRLKKRTSAAKAALCVLPFRHGWKPCPSFKVLPRPAGHVL